MWLFGNLHVVRADYMTLKCSEHAQNHRAHILRRSKFRPLRYINPDTIVWGIKSEKRNL